MSNLQPDTLIKNPQGCHVVSSVEVPADAAKVWAIVGDFAGFERFIPALSHRNPRRCCVAAATT